MVRVLICRLVAQTTTYWAARRPELRPRAHSTYHDRVPAARECALAGSDVAAASDGVPSWSIDRRGVRNWGRWSRMRPGRRVKVASALVAIMRGRRHDEGPFPRTLTERPYPGRRFAEFSPLP